MTPHLQLAFASLLMAGVTLWILSYFQTRNFIRASCELLMSCAVGIFWLLLLLHLLITTYVILPAFTLVELMVVVAIIAILALMIWQAAGPSIQRALRARRRANALGRILALLGRSGTADPGTTNPALMSLRDFFTGNGWTGLAPDKLADVAKELNDLIDAEGAGYSATGLYDWLKANDQTVLAGDFLNKLVERIIEVLENDELTDEQRRQLERLRERLEEIQRARDVAEGEGD